MNKQRIENVVFSLNASIIDNLIRLVELGVIGVDEARQIIRIEPHDDYVESTT